jgi:hypothetical protein
MKKERLSDGLSHTIKNLSKITRDLFPSSKGKHLCDWIHCYNIPCADEHHLNKHLVEFMKKYCLDKDIVRKVLDDEIHPMMYKKRERIFKRLNL